MNKIDFDLEERLLNYSTANYRFRRHIAQHSVGESYRWTAASLRTSALPNHGKAQAAESRNDFLHKMQICLKELRESRRWLSLIERSPRLSQPNIDAPINETEQLIKIFFSSVRTARSNTKDARPPAKGADGSFGRSAVLP